MIYIFILLIVILIGNEIAKHYDKSDKKSPFFIGFFRDRYDGITIPCGILIGICIFLLILGAVIYIDSIGDIAEMEAFQDNTLSAYEYTIEKSENITIYAIKSVEEDMSTLLKTGDLAYFKLAESVNSNLVELRESVRIYNRRLYSYRKYNSFWFTDTFIAEVPNRLKPIKLK
ncbi:unnamed protein product [marine sediment metagenome]|uniref:Uncharacterized protein n=1 Tax=marine sediment metagenome TaxID=412755 RepID=X1U1H3_9ZZZZ